MRFLHFGELIDGPHTWRQCDTAQYAWSFYEEGIDILHPSVCWMGGYKTTILEFPLPEALSAILYRLFGPAHFWSRLVTLLFFCGAAFYFYRILTLILPNTFAAKLSTLVYLSMPLGIYFSRAIHIDFCAVFFAHAMFYHLWQWLRHENPLQLILGALFMSLAFLVKVPYAWYFALPLGIYLISQRKWTLLLKGIPLLIVPVILFILWERHVVRVNGQAPDWSFLPEYHRFDKMAYWYLGSWFQRVDWENWELILQRIRYEILGTPGLLLAPVGLIFAGRKERKTLWIWFLATFLSLFVFFNLNAVHNYYQIPLMAPLALAVGLGMERISSLLGGRLYAFGRMAGLVMLLGFAFYGFRFAEQNYYQVGFIPVGAGYMIQQNTPKDALVAVSYGGLDIRAPHILYRARRYGWSVMEKFLNAQVTEDLRGLGANYLAVVRPEAPGGALGDYLSQFSREEFDLKDGGWKVFLYKIN